MPSPETETRIAELRRKRDASHMPNGSIALGYSQRVAAIDKEIARLEALDD